MSKISYLFTVNIYLYLSKKINYGMQKNIKIKSENTYRLEPWRNIINIIPLLMIIYTNSWNTDDCILWKLINSTQHTGAQSTTKTVHNHLINMRTPAPTPHASLCTVAIRKSHHFYPMGIFDICGISIFWSNSERQNINLLTEQFTLPSVLQSIQNHVKEIISWKKS